MIAARRPRRKRRLLPILALLLAALAILAYLGYGYVMKRLYPIRYPGIIEEMSRESDLPPGLIFAVVRTESGFRPDAVSHLGARGLMQLTEETFEWVRYRTGDSDAVYADLYDPEVNVRYGSQLLRLLLDEFGTVENALCAYHAGWGNVKSWLANPDYSSDGETLDRIPFRDTAHYVDKVERAWNQYKKLYDLQ